MTFRAKWRSDLLGSGSQKAITSDNMRENTRTKVLWERIWVVAAAFVLVSLILFLRFFAIGEPAAVSPSQDLGLLWPLWTKGVVMLVTGTGGAVWATVLWGKRWKWRRTLIIGATLILLTFDCILIAWTVAWLLA